MNLQGEATEPALLVLSVWTCSGTWQLSGGKAVRLTRWPQLQRLVAGPWTAPSTLQSAGPALTTPFPLYLISNQPGSGPCCTDRTHNYILISFQRCMALSLRDTSAALHKHNLRSQRVRFGGGGGGGGESEGPASWVRRGGLS